MSDTGTERMPLTRRTAIDLAAVAALIAVSIVGFGPTFDSPYFLITGFGALVIGLGLAVLGTVLRWGVLPLAAATIAAYFVFGAPLAVPTTTLGGVVPTLESLLTLAGGVVFAWKQFLTAVAPFAASDSFLIVPYLSVLLVSVLSGSIALRARQYGWTLLPAGVLLVLAIAFGMSQPAVPIIQGAVFAVVAIAWASYRRSISAHRYAAESGSTTVHGTGRRVLAAAGVLALAIGLGAGASAVVAPAGPRYVVRDAILPPIDLRNYVSPLQSFRAYVRDKADETLFTVEGLPEGGRVRLATLDAYDGVVYNVASEGAGSSASFLRMGDKIPATVEGESATLEVEIGSLRGVWLPDAGYLTGISYRGDRADDLQRSTFYNRATGVGVVTAGLREGDSYTLEVVLPRTPTRAQLEEAAIAPLALPPQQDVPEGTASMASKLVGSADTPFEQVDALATALSAKGFFSHGLEGEAISRAGHGSERIQALLATPERMIGDDEQYAVTMALLAGQLGLPARVVMGFYPEEEATGGAFAATGEDLHAWVEVAFDEYGWVPFDPTPPEDQVPTDQQTVPQTELQPQTLQPPPPAQDPVNLPPDVPEDEGNEDDDDGGPFAWLAILAWIAAGIGILLVLAAPFLAVLLLKLRRRRRRRETGAPSERTSGAWDEVLDTARDFGAKTPTGGTRREDGAVLAEALATPGVVAVAQRADAGVFGPGEPAEQDVEELWREVDEIIVGLQGSVGFWRRLRSRLSLRSLIRPAGKPARSPRGRTAPATKDRS
ncbi:transglutaminase domain-containing protein [Microbacterium sp. zg-YB36]|uniref:transglutaminase family protein n=1 Tax=Microbacterium sp. zg-YB36 TaxID=2969407 RepID=UPI00214B9C50|nr:transglutaminase domain-containing protein [Microbacterium sp. zg-YB36]MDL5352852.1 transglutaminaseTgpA domain-containing protein [Microbacterium sp. zg-YB36]